MKTSHVTTPFCTDLLLLLLFTKSAYTYFETLVLLT